MREILVLNAGSSSLKFAVFEASANGLDHAPVVSGQYAGLGANPSFEIKAGNGQPLPVMVNQRHPQNPADALLPVITALTMLGHGGRLAMVGHRLVHGGDQFRHPTIVDHRVAVALEQIRTLAPLHMPAGLAVLEAMREKYPHVPQLACFDTAFHATQPELATRIALPKDYAGKGYRRYGFHGLNYEHVCDELPRLSKAPLPQRLLVFHLGNGASICAIKNGCSIATTMGYSTLDGLIMGTRCGTLDPGLVIALVRNEGLNADQLDHLLYRESGLLALSGATSDMRELLARTDVDATFAVDAFCYWAARHAGSLIAALGGLDAIVFTGGMGEKSAPIRARIATHLAWMGIAVNAKQNANHGPRLSAVNATPQVWCVPANEEVAIARHAMTTLISQSQQPDA